ncbi:MAG: Rid family detoxifying hydrolase [Chlamydiia bacterium]|nr:Rid family detoxifying hydrolase [Chlamydiia bacterium]
MRTITAENAPKALGPYSQGTIVGNLIFVSGQLPIDLKSGKLLSGSIGEMTQLIFDHLEAILKQAGSALENMVRVEVFMKDLSQFAEMNEAYAKRVSKTSPPARQTIQVADLPLGSPIEISCIATTSERGS